MESGAGRSLECQKTMVGKNDATTNGLNKAVIPSCCLKARVSDAESEAKCHSTVVSGWFSEPRTSPEKTSKLMYFNNPMWPGSCAAEFLRSAPEGKYDVVIVDSSDPIGPAQEDL